MAKASGSKYVILRCLPSSRAVVSQWRVLRWDRMAKYFIIIKFDFYHFYCLAIGAVASIFNFRTQSRPSFRPTHYWSKHLKLTTLLCLDNFNCCRLWFRSNPFVLREKLVDWHWSPWIDATGSVPEVLLICTVFESNCELNSADFERFGFTNWSTFEFAMNLSEIFGEWIRQHS